MKKYEFYSDWKADQSEANRELIDALEHLITACDSKIVMTVKWGQGCFLKSNQPAAYIHAEAEFIQLGFYSGYLFDDPQHLLKGKGKFVRFIIIESLNDIDVVAFSALIREALKACIKK